MKPPLIYTMPEYRLSVVREVPQEGLCETPEKIYAAWKSGVETASWYSPLQEQLVVFMLNTRCKLIGFKLATLGTLNSTQCEPREVFGPALLAGARTIVIAHNHPSLDKTPSEADIKLTRDFVRAGQLLKIELTDHLIIGGGEKPWCSLREIGYFY